MPSGVIEARSCRCGWVSDVCGEGGYVDRKRGGRGDGREKEEQEAYDASSVCRRRTKLDVEADEVVFPRNDQDRAVFLRMDRAFETDVGKVGLDDGVKDSPERVGRVTVEGQAELSVRGSMSAISPNEGRTKHSLPHPTPRSVATDDKLRLDFLLLPCTGVRSIRRLAVHRVDLIVRKDVRAVQTVCNSDLGRSRLFFGEVAEGDGDGVGGGREVVEKGLVDDEGEVDGCNGAVDGEVVCEETRRSASFGRKLNG